MLRYVTFHAEGVTLSLLRFSDGAGRSGVFLAVDANLELHEEDGKFNIYGYLKKMRQARKELIEKLVGTFWYLFKRLVKIEVLNGLMPRLYQEVQSKSSSKMVL